MDKLRLIKLILIVIFFSHSAFAQRVKPIINFFKWFKNSIPERFEIQSPTTIRKADDFDLSFSPGNRTDPATGVDDISQRRSRGRNYRLPISDIEKELQENYPGYISLTPEAKPDVRMRYEQEKRREWSRKELQAFFQIEGSDLSDEDLCKSINEDLGLIYEFVGKAAWLGDEYQVKYPDRDEMTPGRLSGNYFDIFEFVTNIQGFEKKLLGEYADGKWSQKDRDILLAGIQSLDKEIANIESYKKALGYDHLSASDYYLEGGVFYKISTRKGKVEKIRDYYQQMSELLSFLNYQNLDELNERHRLGLSKVKFDKEIENLLKSEKEECDQLLEMLGYETLEGFERNMQQSELTTLERLRNEKNSVTAILSRLGFDVDDLQQAISRYRQLNDNPQNYHRLLQEENQQNIWYARSGKKYVAFDLDVGKNSPSEQDLTLRCIEVPGFPNNFVRTDTDGSIPIERTLEQVKNNYARRIFGNEIEMLSLVNESTTEELLTNFKKKLVRLKFNRSEEKLKERIKRHIRQREGKSLFILGHVEGRQFVTPLGDDGTLRLDISEVIDWGKDYKVNIFAFGCNTARVTGRSGPGTTQVLNSVNDGVDMMKAIQGSRTVGDIFDNYVSDTRKIIVNGETFQDQHYFRIRVIKTTATAGGALTVGVVTYLLIDGQNK